MKDQECIFCKIANGVIPSETIYEDQLFRVILDLNPASKGHALILTKQHFSDICVLDPAIAAEVMPLAALIGAAMKKALNCNGFNIVQNNGKEAGQTVFHFHTHIIPRYQNDAKMITWESQKSDASSLTSIANDIKRVL